MRGFSFQLDVSTPRDPRAESSGDNISKLPGLRSALGAVLRCEESRASLGDTGMTKSRLSQIASGAIKPGNTERARIRAALNGLGFGSRS